MNILLCHRHARGFLVSTKLRSCPELRLLLLLYKGAAATTERHAAIAAARTLNAELLSHLTAGDSLHNPLGSKKTEKAPNSALRKLISSASLSKEAKTPGDSQIHSHSYSFQDLDLGFLFVSYQMSGREDSNSSDLGMISVRFSYPFPRLYPGIFTESAWGATVKERIVPLSTLCDLGCTRVCLLVCGRALWPSSVDLF